MALTYIINKYEGVDEAPVEDVINYKGLLVNITEQEFLDFDGGTKVNNLDRAWKLYTQEEKEEFRSDFYNNGILPYIKTGTELLYPKDRIDVEKSFLYGSNQVLQQGDFQAYLPDFIELLETDGYVKSESLLLGSNVDSVQLINENIRIWVWVRALDRIINLSPFVRNVQTNKQGDAGAFTIQIDPVLDLDDVIFAGSEVINYFPLKNRSNHVQDIFESYLQQNDLYFIRFERLELEENEDEFSTLEIPIGRLNIPNRVWDMIGLADSIQVSYNAQNTDKVLQVSGRDLMKVLTDDGAYFLPYKYIQGSDDGKKFVYGGNEESSWFKRNFISGAYEYFFSYDTKSIQDALGFIINHLSNIGVVPNQVFDSYTDKSSILSVTGAEGQYLQTKEVNGVWKIIKLKIDEILSNRVFAGDGLMNPDGTLVEFFNQVCQMPFVEFWGDTYGSNFSFTVRQPPFDKSAIRDVWNNGYYIEIDEKDLLSYNLNWDQRSYSSYEIEPQSNFFGAEDGLFKAIVPALALPKFAEVFGNKRLSTKDAYLHQNSLYGDESKLNSSKFIEGVLNDYKYIIESNSYLPFTRTGTITLNGDRRIKKGAFIFNKASNELFHVTGVSNVASFSKTGIDRITTVSVERGMVTNYINESFEYSEGGQAIQGNSVTGRFSYFNIVNVDLFIRLIRQRIEGGTKEEKITSTSFNVDSDNFDFFIERRQMKWKALAGSSNITKLIQ